MKRKLLTILLAMTMAVGCILNVGAATTKRTSVYAGTSVKVTDKATPAVSVRGVDPNTMCFVSAQDKELGSISYTDYNAVIDKHSIFVPYESGASQKVPPNNARKWEEWLAAEFNEHRGLPRTVNDDSGVFNGYSLLILSAESRAKTIRARTGDPGTMLFMSEHNIEVATISYKDYQGMMKQYGTAVKQDNGSTKYNPPGQYQTWKQWFLDQFHNYTGAKPVQQNTPEKNSANGGDSTSGSGTNSAKIGGQDSGITGSSGRKLMTPAELDEAIEEVFRLTNEERARQGVQPLRMDDELMDYAAIRAEELVQVYGHTRPDGSRALSHKEVRAENAYKGVNAKQAVAGWIKSSGHHKNMIGAGYTKIGIGLYQDESGTLYWIQVFGYDQTGPKLGGPRGSKYA